MTGILQRLFSRPKNKANAQKAGIPTRPLSPDELPQEKEAGQRILEPPQLIVGCAQSVGKQRDHNEDALFTLTTTLASDHTHLPFGLYIVADGMGGHQHGELASGIAVRSMAGYIVKKLYVPLFALKQVSPEESILEIMQNGVQEAHRAISKEAPGGGTTLTAALILGEQMTLAHVGDSRAYSVSPTGMMQALTRDHSLVKRLVELGQITTEEAATHPQRNVLYRALGQGDAFDADVSTHPLLHAGHILLCSDGLWGVISEEAISQIILDTPNPQEACQEMIDAANAAGGPDNITAILVRMPD